jgi:hypothetical protein
METGRVLEIGDETSLRPGRFTRPDYEVHHVRGTRWTWVYLWNDGTGQTTAFAQESWHES